MMMKRMLATACVVLLACADGAEEGTMIEEDTLAMEEPATETIALADVAGTWNLAVTTEQGDSVPGLQLVASADPSGWTMVYPDRDPIPVTVQASGDSIVTDAGPYASLIREGVQVSTHMVYRVEGDRLTGSGIARYETAESDSVVSITVVGTRAP